MLVDPSVFGTSPALYGRRAGVSRTFNIVKRLVLGVAALNVLVLGMLLVLLGLIMLVTPGQGILTLLVGLLLMNFPGKYQLERWLVSRRGVMRALDWLRKRKGQPPFDPPAF